MPSRPLLVALLTAVLLGLPPAVGSTAADPGHVGGVRPVPGEVLRPFDDPEPYGPGHRGVDLAAAPGDPVRSALSGTVRFAGPVAGTTYVSVDHGGGLRTTYGDLRPVVARGDAITAGQVIGTLRDGAPHLDWGAPVDAGYLDPLLLLSRWEMRLTSGDVPLGRPVVVEDGVLIGWP